MVNARAWLVSCSGFPAEPKLISGFLLARSRLG
jgi:hypothetical protein